LCPPRYGLPKNGNLLPSAATLPPSITPSEAASINDCEAEQRLQMMMFFLLTGVQTSLQRAT